MNIGKCIDKGVDCIVNCGDVNRRFCIRICVKEIVACVLDEVRPGWLHGLADIDRELAKLRPRKPKRANKRR